MTFFLAEARPEYCELHTAADFGGLAPALTAECANRALAEMLDGSLDARREYARYAGNGAPLADLSGLVYDVRMLISRKASARLGRPEQTAVVMHDGRIIDVDRDTWFAIYNRAVADRNYRWTPSYRREGDRWAAKWAAIKLGGNEYGRLMARRKDE